jgi:hypothetical protein
MKYIGIFFYYAVNKYIWIWCNSLSVKMICHMGYLRYDSHFAIQEWWLVAVLNSCNCNNLIWSFWSNHLALYHSSQLNEIDGGKKMTQYDFWMIHATLRRSRKWSLLSSHAQRVDVYVCIGYVMLIIKYVFFLKLLWKKWTNSTEIHESLLHFF